MKEFKRPTGHIYRPLPTPPPSGPAAQRNHAAVLAVLQPAGATQQQHVDVRNGFVALRLGMTELVLEVSSLTGIITQASSLKHANLKVSLNIFITHPFAGISYLPNYPPNLSNSKETLIHPAPFPLRHRNSQLFFMHTPHLY